MAVGRILLFLLAQIYVSRTLPTERLPQSLSNPFTYYEQLRQTLQVLQRDQEDFQTQRLSVTLIGDTLDIDFDEDYGDEYEYNTDPTLDSGREIPQQSEIKFQGSIETTTSDEVEVSSEVDQEEEDSRVMLPLLDK